MKTLQIQHVAESEPAQFRVVRLPDGRPTGSVSVTSPVGFEVPGAGAADLMDELSWYLEKFLEYPFPPRLERAERVQQALAEWGTCSFNALFGSRETGRFFDQATAEGYSKLHLQIASDDPHILAWPWEALRDPEAEVLAHNCQIERRLGQVRDPIALSPDLPQDRVNILLVTARPFDEDVPYRSISRPLVELVHRGKVPARAHLLRPPTLAALRGHLSERPNHYHILHFDGHGGYGSGGPRDESLPYQLCGPRGRLIFEDDNGAPAEIDVDQLAPLLRDFALPAVVLNACQSGKIDGRAEDAFASVAAALIKAGRSGTVRHRAARSAAPAAW